ncbi:MAG: glycyl radical protein, partial [Candidatus Sumerlaeota bacterium]|nr:glycyl radical protein [Candidatus Sumerlaeota bacterium]
WVKFNEVRIAVDFINYQNLIVGGVDSDGADATNELTWLCLETTEQLRTHQPSLSLRWHEGCPPALLEKACEMIRSGLGLPALFNDRIIVGSLHRAGVSWDDARDYAIAGCEELAVPGKLFGVIRGQKVEQSKCLLRALFNGHDPYSHRSSNAAQVNGHDFQTFDELLQAYRAELSRATHETIARSKAADEANAKFTPHPFVSLLFDGCLERGLDLTRGGARYNITSMTEAGTITAADSLLAIRKAVFEDKILSLGEFRQALLDNFDGHEALRQWLLNQVPKFGNDEDTIDELARQLADMSCDVIEEIGEPDFRGGVFVTGSGGSTAWLAGKQTGATPDGRRAGEALSVSLGPTAGADRNGPTATLNSVAKLNWVRQAGGALTHLKFPAAALAGREGLHNLAALIATFFRRGGMGVHISVVDRATLLAARAEPEKHRDLLVRVGGFSAPFTLLSREIQDNIIARTEQALE